MKDRGLKGVMTSMNPNGPDKLGSNPARVFAWLLVSPIREFTMEETSLQSDNGRFCFPLSYVFIHSSFSR